MTCKCEEYKAMIGELVEALEALRSMYPSEADMLKVTHGNVVTGFTSKAIKTCQTADVIITKAKELLT